MTLLDYQLRMIKIIFPRVPPEEFQAFVKKYEGNWLTAARMYHAQHPESLFSFAMRYGVGATPYHPLCDLIAEVRPDEAPSEASSGGRAEREKPAAPVKQTTMPPDALRRMQPTGSGTGGVSAPYVGSVGGGSVSGSGSSGGRAEVSTGSSPTGAGSKGGYTFTSAQSVSSTSTDRLSSSSSNIPQKK